MRSGRCFLIAIFLLCATAFSQGIDPGFEIMEWKGGEVMKDEVLVKFRGQTALPGSLGCEVIETVAPQLLRIQLNGMPLDAALDAFNRDPAVEYAEPHVLYRTFYVPNDSSWSQQWGPKNINCPAAWDIHQGSAGCVVAILDSSVDYTHADLAAHYQYGYDYFNGDSDPYSVLDFIGHGTHCSGIAAAVTDNGKGIAGVGFDCKFAFYQVGLVLVISDAAVIQSINDTIARGWQVISMSFGGASPSQSMKSALENAHAAGVVCVAAAGNDGTTAMLYPAGYPTVLSVASHGQTNQKSSFSTYGNWVDVSAPGEGIYSTIYELWGGYTNMDGTSMACPHVAGMANVLYSLIGGARNQANADLIRSAIEDSSIAATWVKHGRVDLEAAMLELTGPKPPEITDVTPSQVQAFMGGTITLTGSDFTDVTEVNSGGTVLLSPDFTVVNDSTITYDAPTAAALGITEVTVTGPAGTSGPANFTYVETDPPRLAVAASVNTADPLAWTYGGGAADYFLLLVYTDSTTFPFHGFDVLLNYVVLHSGFLDAVGLGNLGITVPSGLVGITFYSQVVTFEPSFVGASDVKSTTVIN